MGDVERLIRNGHSGIGVGGMLRMNDDSLTLIQIGCVPIVPVARPDHPLALADREGGSRP
jgi:DNA-binding transcriptional LysR family regulator